MMSASYLLVFRGYSKENLCFEEKHLFNDLTDLYSHAAWLINQQGPYECYDHYDIRIEFVTIDPMPSVA